MHWCDAEVLVKGLDVQTARLLVYRTVSLDGINGVPQQGNYATIALLPHTVKTLNGSKTWWVGPTGNMAEAPLPAAAPFLAAIEEWEGE